MIDIDFELIDKIPTPSYVIEEKKIIRNLEILDSVQKQTGCKILLAQKAFSMFALYPLIGKYLKGTTASGLYEAKLGHEYMGGETHIFSPAYPDEEFDEITQICDHIIFNSFEQLNKFKSKIKNNQIGLRVNPEYSEIEHEIYNPCAKNSRFGVKLNKILKNKNNLKDINGLHFHTMCEQNSDVLWRTVQIFDEKFGDFFKLDNIKWINFGGGHHITRSDYDIETLVRSIMFIKNKYNISVYLEPGEAIALNTGVMVSTVLDIIDNTDFGDQFPVAILDASAACHMPDVLEMPYRPEVLNAGKPGEKKYNYRFGANTCLAGDIIGDYSFDYKLKSGDKIIFGDMAHYTMVKTNTFNGVKLPSIILLKKDSAIKIIKEFGYEDFKNRLS
ncbi:MAG: carboxynorspermidine decarboxylase [Oscillospiraceae bacterium]|nr:carboxynorspermidine decarboxylase [Oscillospiraceae bacterium]